jgi:hypothetical protein
MLISDTGGITTAMHSLELNREDQCRYLAERFTTRFAARAGNLGRAYEVKSKGICIDNRVGGAPGPALPQDLLEFLNPGFVTKD